MRQTDGVILEAIYYDVVRTSYTRRPPAPTKQMLLYGCWTAPVTCANGMTLSMWIKLTGPPNNTGKLYHFRV